MVAACLLQASLEIAEHSMYSLQLPAAKDEARSSVERDWASLTGRPALPPHTRGALEEVPDDVVTHADESFELLDFLNRLVSLDMTGSFFDAMRRWA